MTGTVTFYCLHFCAQCVTQIFFFNAWKKGCKFLHWEMGSVVVLYIYLLHPFVMLSFATFVDRPLKLKACCSNLTEPILYSSALVLLLHMYFFSFPFFLKDSVLYNFILI